jgi:Arc/MetJ-type ribon-helix-helix transcriptional regulator
MIINLSPEDQQRAEALVASGRFSSIPDALHAGLEAIQLAIVEEEEWKDYAKDRIAAGMDDVREGRTIPVEDFIEELRGMRQQKA